MEKKISKGIVAGCLAIVLALTIWVININDTYSMKSSEIDLNKCIIRDGLDYLCCESDEAYPTDNGCVIGKNENDVCPDGTRENGSLCITSVIIVPIVSCYICDGKSENNSNYFFARGNPSYSCKNGKWGKAFEYLPGVSPAKDEGECRILSNDKYVYFEVNNKQESGGKFYQDGNISNIFRRSLYEIDFSKYTAEFSDNSDKEYSFIGWDTVNSCTSPKKTGTMSVTEDMNLYACYSVESTEEEVKTYSVTLNASSRKDIDGVVYENDTNKNVKEYTISNVSENTDFDLSKYSGKIEGYTFKGWSPMQLCLTTVSNYKITKDSKFYACYDKDTESKDEKIYKITFDPNGGTWSDGIKTKKNKEYSSKKNLKDSDIVITRKGYKFAGWKDNNGKVFIDYIDYSNNGSYLTAVWEKDSSFVDDPDSNPNTGNSLIYIFMFFGLLTLVYLVSNVKKNKIG